LEKSRHNPRRTSQNLTPLLKLFASRVIPKRVAWPVQNLSAAQSAFATLQKDAQSVSATQGTSQMTAQTSVMQKVKSDAQTLSTALSTGNLGAAQQAFATLKQDSATAQRMHGHHGHDGMRVASSSSSASSGSTSSDLLATQAISSVGGTLNVTA
jgi:hypothetical protein